jgi:hypothetical protein
MKLKYYQTAVRYKNKMDDFHGWLHRFDNSHKTTRHDAKR